MAQFYTLLTQVGQAKLANAVALGNTIELTHLAVGDGGGSLPTPDSNRTALVNEVRRAPINLADIDPDNPNWIVVEQVLPPDVGGWTIREIGVFDSAGDLIAYGNYPETFKPTLDQGSGRTQTIRMVLQVSDTAAVTLRVDPSVVLATRKYVDDQRKAHEESRNHPAATESAQGMIQRATNAQALDGTDNTRAMTPARVKGAIDDRIANQSTVDAGADDAKFVTPKKLKDWATQWVKQATETVAGMLKVATQEQVDAGEDDATAVTPKTLRMSVSMSLGTAGYVALPSWLGGIIFQWGQIGVAGGSTATQTFPIAYPNAVYQVVGVPAGTSASAVKNLSISNRSGDLNTVSFRIDNQSASANEGFRWVSVGR